MVAYHVERKPPRAGRATRLLPVFPVRTGGLPQDGLVDILTRDPSLR